MAQSKRPTTRGTVEIAAPVDKVFSYFADPANLPEVWPSLVEVRNVVYEEGRPVSCDWTYKMAGMRFEGSSLITGYEPNRLYAYDATGGINSWTRVTFEERGGKTLVSEVTEYEIPVPLLGRFAERFLRRINQNELDTILANLKAIMEAGSEAEAAAD